MEKIKRRVDDHERRLLASEGDIETLKSIHESVIKMANHAEKIEDYAQKTYDVFKPLATISGYVVKIGALVLLVWHATKWVLIKLGLFS